MYTVKEEIFESNSFIGTFLIETYIGNSTVLLHVEYEPPENGSGPSFGSMGMISNGSPSFPSTCSVYEAWICDKNDVPFMELSLNHRLLEIDEAAILQEIEDFLKG